MSPEPFLGTFHPGTEPLALLPFPCSPCGLSKDVSRHNSGAKRYCLSDRLIVLEVLLSEASP